MSRISDYFRRRRVDPLHHTRRALSRYVFKRGFEIGDFTYGIPRIMPWGNAKLIIGRYCSIAQGVTIFLGGNHRTDWISTYPFIAQPLFRARSRDPEYSRGDVTIGSDVWIGADATILSGVNIGHGAVVGACAVVRKDIPPYAIVVGNPGQIVRYRFEKQQIQSLLDIAWWDFAPDRIIELLPLMCATDIETFIKHCQK